MKLRLLASACLLAYLPSAAFAQDQSAETAASDNAFSLGQIIVTALRHADGIAVTGETHGPRRRSRPSTATRSTKRST